MMKADSGRRNAVGEDRRSAAESRGPETGHILKPLRPGDRIALVAPASPFDREKFDRARETLENKGYRLTLGKHIFNSKGYLAGTEAERAEDLIRAISDPSVAAIICIRGGYGSGRLLPWLPFSVLRKNRKVFLGYSDITFLHLAFQSQMRWVTFHGPNFMEIADSHEKAEEVLTALRGDSDFSQDLAEFQILRHGIASGKLLGGNLTCLNHLLGTPYLPDLKGTLLLIEDCGEALYRLDRLFTQLKLAGVLQDLAGLLLGRFKDCGEGPEIHNMVLEQVDPYNFPVIGNFPFGHGPENQVVPFGLPFSLNTYELSFRALQRPFEE